MDNSEKFFEIQKRLFDEIQENHLRSNQVLVDEISDVLKTGRDSAYRRIRCDKLLSIKETYILCKHFQISLDALMMDVKNINLFNCIYRPIDLTIPNEYYNYLLSLEKNIEKVRTAHNSSLFMSATDIPVFHLITQKELTLFKLFTWSQSVYDYKGSMDDFFQEIDTPELISYYQKISKNYELVPSTEIWTENTINTTLRLISYYIDICSFSNKELPLLLCEQVLNILSKLQEWAENSAKDDLTSFKFYVSEMELENSYLLIKQSETTNCIVKLFTINSLNVFDKEFCKETENWLKKLSQRSVLLCGNSEKERIKFFNTQRQKVHFLTDKITKSF
ncbi:MAG: hypothetical protein FWC41_03615 [Firmicutes bacterium]|nr:hypothetical protein [Bacillota bacterium]